MVIKLVLKVLTEVVKFSTHGFNYPTTFSSKIFYSISQFTSSKFKGSSNF